MIRITDLSSLTRSMVMLLAALSFAGSAAAEVNLWVESRTNADPIEAFVRVTDANGPVPALAPHDFSVTLDGFPVSTFTFSLPPDQDPTRRISVVFVLNNGGFADAIQGAVRQFINQMAIGNYAAVVKTRYSVDPDLNVQLVQPFTQIDGGSGTNTLADFVTVVSRQGFPKLLDSLMLAVDQFTAPPEVLPEGPKAIILAGSGRADLSGESMSDVIAAANSIGIPLFTIEVGDNAVVPEATARMASLAADTGGVHFAAPDDLSIAEAYATVASLLTGAYRLAMPPTIVSDCNLHMLEISAQGQSAGVDFTRCDSTPDNFSFPDQPNVSPGATVTSDAVTITGFDSPVAVTVIGGEYSIGCGSNFASAQGLILPEEKVCLRHIASQDSGGSASTLLIAGGVSSTFWSSTRVTPPPPPPPPPPGAGAGSGGGGAIGLAELLLALGGLGRRRYQR